MTLPTHPNGTNTHWLPPVAPGCTLQASPAGGRRDDCGLATLEWLLVIAAAGGFAAAMAVGFQALIDDTTELAEDPHAAMIEAGIAAARISRDAAAAQTALEASPGDPRQATAAQAALAALAQQCESVATAYPDAVKSADWIWLAIPVETPAATPTTAPDGNTPAPMHTGGRWVCRITYSTP